MHGAPAHLMQVVVYDVHHVVHHEADRHNQLWTHARSRQHVTTEARSSSEEQPRTISVTTTEYCTEYQSRMATEGTRDEGTQGTGSRPLNMYQETGE